MSLDDEDDFWNSSGVKAFSFDDEDNNHQTPNVTGSSNIINSGSSYAISTAGANSSSSTHGVKTLGSILAAKPSSNEPFLRPSMIMCKENRVEELIQYLDDSTQNTVIPTPVQDPKTYIRDIVDKRVPIDFSQYKSKREKLLLLDCAMCCSDGNAITAATIFIYKTLKLSIFIEEMKKRPVAVDHFLNFLEVTGRSREAIEYTKKLSKN